MKDTPAERAARKYRDGLANLAGMKGRRNASLLGLTNLGVLAGLQDERILAEVRDASGTPPLTDEEIKHALRTSRRDTVPLTDGMNTTRAWTQPPKPTPPLGTGAASYVARMIARGAGATFETLAACSPSPIPPDTRGQTRAFLSGLYSAEELLLIGKKYDAGIVGDTIRTVSDWCRLFDQGTTVPPLMVANPLTGREGVTKEGKPSYRCEECVAAYRFALVEFDELPMSEQCAFWAEVIDSGTLPLRSLVYSGGKSIHGLVKLDAADSDDWRRLTDKLFFAVANPKAADNYRADPCCKKIWQGTRTPGALRSETGKPQTLLWLSSETA